MKYDVQTTDEFEYMVEYYLRKKKYSNIINDISKVVEHLENGTLLGDKIPLLKLSRNEHTYKVRIANTSANVGKSNGFRLIYYVIKDKIYFLTIYSKKDNENISRNEILQLIRICRDLKTSL